MIPGNITKFDPAPSTASTSQERRSCSRTELAVRRPGAELGHDRPASARDATIGWLEATDHRPHAVVPALTDEQADQLELRLAVQRRGKRPTTGRAAR